MERAISYSFSKLGVLKLGERKAMNWGPRGGWAVTISPGLILTQMGRQELENTPGAKETLDAAPVGRPGTAMDIAGVAKFLSSPEASFINGSDVRVDGGAYLPFRCRKSWAAFAPIDQTTVRPPAPLDGVRS